MGAGKPGTVDPGHNLPTMEDIKADAIKQLWENPGDWENIREILFSKVSTHFADNKNKKGEVVKKAKPVLAYEQNRRWTSIVFTVWRTYAFGHLLDDLASLIHTNNNKENDLNSTLLAKISEPRERKYPVYAKGHPKDTDSPFQIFTKSLMLKNIACTDAFRADIQGDKSHPARSLMEALPVAIRDATEAEYGVYCYWKYDSEGKLRPEPLNRRTVEKWQEKFYLRLSLEEAKDLSIEKIKEIERNNYQAELNEISQDPLGSGIPWYISDDNADGLTDIVRAGALSYRYRRRLSKKDLDQLNSIDDPSKRTTFMNDLRRTEAGELVEPELPLAIDHSELATLILNDLPVILRRTWLRRGAELRLKAKSLKATSHRDPYAGDPRLMAWCDPEGKLVQLNWNALELQTPLDNPGNCALIPKLPPEVAARFHNPLRTILGYLGVPPEPVLKHLADETQKHGTPLELGLMAAALVFAQLSGSLFTPPRFPGEPTPLYPFEELDQKFAHLAQTDPGHAAQLLATWLEKAHLNAAARHQESPDLHSLADIQALSSATAWMRYTAYQFSIVDGNDTEGSAQEETTPTIDYTYDTEPEPFPLTPATQLIRELPLKHLETLRKQLPNAIRARNLPPEAGEQLIELYDRITDTLIADAAQRLSTEDPKENLALQWLTDKAPNPPASASKILTETNRIRAKREQAQRPRRSGDAVTRLLTRIAHPRNTRTNRGKPR